MSDEYQGISFKNLAILGGVVTATTVVVLVAYGWFYGFDNFQQETMASSQAAPAGFFTPTRLHAFTGHAAPNATTSSPRRQAGVAGQYICPQHGPVGMPAFAPGGGAQCPLCGQGMRLHCLNNVNALRSGAFYDPYGSPNVRNAPALHTGQGLLGGRGNWQALQ